MIGVLLTSWLSVGMTMAAPSPTPEGAWLSQLRRLNDTAASREFGDCSIRAIPGAEATEGGVCRAAYADDHAEQYTVARAAFDASTRLVEEAPEYALTSTGDGPGTLSDRYRNSTTVNCTSSLEATMTASIHGDSNWRTCWNDPVIRYLPGMEGSFFGRAHYYETEWRPNLMGRGLATEVTGCLTEGLSCSYDYRMDGARFKALMTRQLGSSATGKKFVAHIGARAADLDGLVRRLATSDCRALARVDAALRLDWTFGGPQQGNCSTPEGRTALADGYLSLLRDVRTQTIERLDANPVIGRTPCVSIGRGASLFNPDRAFPAAWRRPGTVLLVAFVKDGNVRHQGMVIFRDGKWWVRHASSIRGKFVEEEMTEFLRSNRGGFTGMNFLAPRDSSGDSWS